MPRIPSAINLLIILIVSGYQADDLEEELLANGFYFTQIDSSGGVLNEPTECLLIGLDRDRLDLLLKVLEKCCKRTMQYIPTQMNIPPNYAPLPMIEAQVGGALLYALNIERFEQI